MRKLKIYDPQKKKKKVFIIGQISGLPLEEARKKFEELEIRLKRKGYTPVMPVELNPDIKYKTNNEYLLENIKNLLECDGYYTLFSWLQSKESKIEYEIAYGMDLEKIEFEYNNPH